MQCLNKCSSPVSEIGPDTLVWQVYTISMQSEADILKLSIDIRLNETNLDGCSDICAWVNVRTSESYFEVCLSYDGGMASSSGAVKRLQLC